MQSSDIVIIGGGVLGCAIAYYLARIGTASVLLLERRSVGSANSARAAGLLSRPRTKAALIPWVLETYTAIAALEDELDQALGLRQAGSLHIASSERGRTGLAELAQVAAGAGVATTWLSPAEAMRLAPWLALDVDTAVVSFPEDAFIDPYLLTQAYARAARARGVVIREGVDVQAIRRAGDWVIGVATSEGPVGSQMVIDAAGPWAIALAWQLGIGLPMAPVRSQYWITAPHRFFGPHQPMVLLPDARAYARPELGSLLFGLREANCVHFDPLGLPDDLSRLRLSDQPEGWDSLMEGLPALLPFFPTAFEVGIAHYIAGLSTYTPDGMFVLGAVPGVEGLLVATGCSGGGIAASGGIGRALAELAVGHPPGFDLLPHRMERFGRVDPTDLNFRQRCADARSGKRAG